MSEIKDKLLEKINYLEKNRDVILERLLSIGECSYYEKFKKDCGIKISILDRLIELGKQYRDKDLSEKNQKDENGFEDKAYEILNSIDPNDSRDVIIEISSFEENMESEDFVNDLKHILKGNIDEIIIALMELDEIRKLNYILEL